MTSNAPLPCSGCAGNGPVTYESVTFQYPPTDEIKDGDKAVQATVTWSDGDIETLSLHEWKDARARDTKRPGDPHYKDYDGLDSWLIDRLKEHFEADHLGRMAEEAIMDGTWKDAVRAALDCSIVGEDHLRMILLYSGMSSCLSERFHVFINGDSQKGKTYIEEKVGELFPSDRLITIQTMSAKAAYYNTEQYGPDYYANKILALDEFKDLSSDAMATFKALMNMGNAPLTNDTVNDHKKAVRQVIEGRPVIWANSAELFDDAMSQLKNRFFTASIDETDEQDKRVNEWQRHIAKYGRPAEDVERLELAKAIISRLVGEYGYGVLIPLINSIKQKDTGNRAEFERFRVLVSSITFANRNRRTSFEHEGTSYLLTTLSDMKEAVELWTFFDRSQSTGLAPRHLKVIAALNRSSGMALDEIVEAVNDSERKGKSAKTILNYLDELAKRDQISTKYDPPKDDGERPIKKYYLVNAQDSQSSQFSPTWSWERKNKFREMLAIELDRLESIFPNFPTERDNVIDAILDLPEGVERPPSPVDETTMRDLIVELHDPKLHHDRSSLKDAFPSVDVERLIFEGRITEEPRGRLTWH